MAKFLNLDTEPAEEISKIGQKLKSKKAPTKPQKIETEAVEQVATEQGYDRTAKPRRQAAPAKPKLGRPALNEDMTYWKIYLSADLRDWLEHTREAKKYRRLNDLLEDMRDAYEKSEKIPKRKSNATAQKRR